MEIRFRKNKLQKQMSSASEIKKAFGVMAKKVAARLDEIAASPNLAILMQIPAANCHALIADRKGQWALNISGNFRIIFEIDHDPIPLKDDGSVNTILVTIICVTDTEDYH
jgi:plasmid maintenance system killer protein